MSAELRKELGLPDLDDTPDDGDGFSAELGQKKTRGMQRALFSLTIVGLDGGVTSFQYAHLDSCSTLTGNAVIALRFLGLRSWDVRLEGRSLANLYNSIMEHRCGRIDVVDAMRAAAAPPGEAVVVKATIGEVETREE